MRNSNIKRALVALLICLCPIFQCYSSPLHAEMTRNKSNNKLQNTAISPLKTKKSFRSIILSMDGVILGYAVSIWPSSELNINPSELESKSNKTHDLNSFTEQSIVLSLDGPPREFYKKATDLQNKSDETSALNNFTESLPLLIQAYESAERNYGTYSGKTIFLLNQLAFYSKILGHTLEAAKYYQEAVDRMNKSEFVLTNILDILKNLSSLYIYKLGDFNKALPVQTSIVDIEENLKTVEKAQLAISIGDLGFVKYNLGQFNDAISLDKKALDIFDQAQASESDESVMLRNNLAMSYIAINDNKNAMFFLEQALNIQKKRGKLELVNGYILNNMALISHNKGQYNEAASLQEKALIIFASLEPQGGMNTVTLLDGLIDNYRELDDVKNLLPPLKKRVAILKKILGANHERTIDAIGNLAYQLLILAQYKEALSELQFIDDLPERDGSFNKLKIISLLMKSGIYIHLSDFDTSNKILSHVKYLSQKYYGIDSPYKKFAEIFASTVISKHISDINNLNSKSGLLKNIIRDLAELKFDRNSVIDLENASLLRASLNLLSIVNMSQNKPIEAITLEARSLTLSYIYFNKTSLRDTVAERAGAENLNNAISENLLPFKVREDIRMEQKNEKKSKKKSLTSI